jgi:hypothetical protein
VELLASAAGQPGGPPGRVLLLQHPPVYTLGAGATPQHLRFDAEDPPHPLYRVERGGEVTYHGPGQVRRDRGNSRLPAAATDGRIVTSMTAILNSTTTPLCQDQPQQAPGSGFCSQRSRGPSTP